MRSIGRRRRRVGRVVLGLLVGLLALAAVALAAHPLDGHSHPLKGHLYAGHVRQARVGEGGRLYRDRGMVFAVSRDGRTMQLRGRTAFTEACYRNGRMAGRLQALVAAGRRHADASVLPAPRVRIRPNGTFYGAGTHSFKRRGQTSHYHFAGQFTAHGQTAEGRFFINQCASPPFHLSALATTRARAAATTSGLVAAYGFDEGSGSTVTDASGNGNNGTITNANWASAGKYGKALQFNGTNALVTIPDNASLHLSSGMTLEAWVDPSTVNANWRDVIYKGNDNFYLEATSTNASRPDAGMIAGGSYADAFGTAKLPANTWSFLTETYDGTTLRLYVNGTQVASTAHTGSIAISTNPLQIGGDSLYGQYFTGLIDNIRVYNTALTATQIQTDQATAVSSGPDTSPPTQPGTLTATAVSGGEIDLSWGASNDNVGVTGYQVERCQGTGCSNFAQIATPTGTSYKDTTVSANNSYSYRVRATDAAGNLSSYSNTASATTPTPDTSPPTQPGTLTANAASASEVDLAWGASNDNVGVTGYQVERCQGTGCSNFAQIATPTGTSYQDTTVSASTSYSYRVRATDAAGNLSPYSNTANASTPAAPSGLVAAYGFDEGSGSTVTDASGNGNNGTITNATWASAGKYGKALQFNGTNAVVTIPDNASLHLSSGMTVEAWVNPSTVNANWRDVIYKGNDNFYLEATSSSAGHPDAGMIAGGSYADAFGTSALPANTWSFLTETYDGTTLRLYVNGIQVAATAHTGAIASSTNPLQIGGDSLYGQYFAGLIDEVRVYNTALSATQIQTDQITPVGASLPSAPGTLTANAVSASEVDLAWGASSGGSGVTGYQLERCQGTGCSNFAQIATPTGTSYKDTRSAPRPATATACARWTRSATSARTRTSRRRRPASPFPLGRRRSRSRARSSSPLRALVVGAQRGRSMGWPAATPASARSQPAASTCRLAASARIPSRQRPGFRLPTQPCM